MPQFKVAHLHEQGQDLIIIPVDSAFGCKSGTERNKSRAKPQPCASATGLAGRVVLVRDSGGGRMAFFRGLALRFVASNISRRLACG